MVGRPRRCLLPCCSPAVAAAPTCTLAVPPLPLVGRRLSQMAPAHKKVGDAQVQAAIREAEALLEDVRGLDIYP